MKLFILLSLAAACLFALATILSKHFLDKEVDDHVFTGSIFGWPFFILYLGLGFLNADISFDLLTSVPSFLAGALYSLILVLYLRGLHEEEASRFIPTIAANTVFLAVFSFIFLGQSFTIVEYLGMLMTVAGAVLLSLEDPLKDLKELHSSKGAFYALLVALLIGVRDTMLEFSAAEIWITLFWMGVGGFTFSITLLLVRRRRKINLRSLKKRSDMIATGSIRAIGFMAYVAAITVGPAAKASAVLKVNGVLVFLGASALSKLRPEFIQEETGYWKLLQKLVSALIILAGVILLQ